MTVAEENRQPIALQDKLAFTITETAKISSSSRTSIYKEIKSGRLIATKLGARTLIKRSNFDAWLGNL